jgi:hypothetical protein
MRAIRIIFIATLALLMLIPGTQMIYPFVDIPILQENRRLAQFPDLLSKITAGDGKLSKDINKWFDDNMGFRPILTRVANQLDYSLFHHSKLVEIGADGWFHDNTWISHQVVRERNGDRTLEESKKQFDALADYLDRRGVKLVILSVPLSATLYPNSLGPTAPQFERPTQFQRLREFLKSKNNRWIYIDGIDVLTPYRDRKIWFKLDHHFTPLAAYHVSRALIARLSQHERRPDPWDHVFEWERKPAGGAFLRYLSILTPLSESYETPNRASSYDEHNPPPYHVVTRNAGRFELILENRGPRQNKFAPGILFGNSYADFLTPLGVYDYFSKLYRIRGNVNDLGPALKELPPDIRYFIVQFIEPWFDGIAFAELPRE